MFFGFRLAAESILIRTFSCMSCTSIGKAAVFYFPGAPKRGHHRPLPAAAPAPGPSQQWHQLPSFAAPAPDIGCVGGTLN